MRNPFSFEIALFGMVMHTVTLARNAMATRFELVLHGDDPVMLRAAGEEALAEIDRLEEQLSLYRPTSEIAHLNARAAQGPVRVTPEVFHLLERAAQLTGETEGAFDITVGPLVRCWGFMGGTGHAADPAAVERARELTGMHQVRLDPASRSVQFTRPGVMIDLGAIGKGYAIECAAELLREAGVTSALIHGGTSTAYALGHPPGQPCWKIAIDHPPDATLGVEELVATVELKDEALSVSARWGRQFIQDGVPQGHVLDPRTGRPADQAVMAAVALPSATETDALSTALLTAGPTGHDLIAKLRPGIRTVLVFPRGQGLSVQTHGISSVWGQKRV